MYNFSDNTIVSHNEDNFLRLEVAADGDCGFTAFGITRSEAIGLLIENLCNNEVVKFLIQQPLREVMFSRNFRDYVQQQGIFPNYVENFDNYVVAQKSNNIELANNFQSILNDYLNDLNFLQLYINYDVRDKKVDCGWSHPAILQSLAEIRNLKLNIFTMEGDFLIIPHSIYSNYIPIKIANVSQEVNLLFINGNHFERLEKLSKKEILEYIEYNKRFELTQEEQINRQEIFRLYGGVSFKTDQIFSEQSRFQSLGATSFISKKLEISDTPTTKKFKLSEGKNVMYSTESELVKGTIVLAYELIKISKEELNIEEFQKNISFLKNLLEKHEEFKNLYEQLKKNTANDSVLLELKKELDKNFLKLLENIEYLDRVILINLPLNIYNPVLLSLLDNKDFKYIESKNSKDYIMDLFLGKIGRLDEDGLEKINESLLEFYTTFISYIKKTNLSDLNQEKLKIFQVKFLEFCKNLKHDKSNIISNNFSLLIEELITKTDSFPIVILLEKLSENDYLPTFLQKEEVSMFFRNVILKFLKNKYFIDNFNDNIQQILISLSKIIFLLKDDDLKSIIENVSNCDDYKLKILIQQLYKTMLKLFQSKLINTDNICSFFKLLIEKNKLFPLQNILLSRDASKATVQILKSIIQTDDKEFDLEVAVVESYFKKLLFKSLLEKDPSSVFVRSDFKNHHLIKELVFYLYSGVEEFYEENNELEEYILKFPDLLNNFFHPNLMENSTNYLERLKVVLKNNIGIGTIRTRLNYLSERLEKIDLDNTELDFLKYVYLNTNNKEEFCKSLSRLGKLDKLQKLETENLLETLRSNVNFKKYEEELSRLKLKINISEELSRGLSLPFYLSGKILRTTEQENNLAFSCAIVIFFKCFICNYMQNQNKKEEELIENAEEYEHMFAKIFSDIQFIFSALYKKVNEDFCNEMKNTIYVNLLKGLSENHDGTPLERYNCIKNIFENIINNKVIDNVDEILKSNSKEEKEIINIFNNCMFRKDLDLYKWKEKATENLKGEIFRLCCIYKYPEPFFDECFKRLNDAKEIPNDVRKKIKDDFHKNLSIFKKIGFSYLQHNQTGALALLEQDINLQKSIVMKCGTGQGKSLLIAETVRKIIERANADNRSETNKSRIWIFTCYNSLAQRDHDRFAIYYNHFNIKSKYIPNPNEWNKKSIPEQIAFIKDINESQVIYSNLDTFFQVNGWINKNILEITNFPAMVFPGESDVIIGDEFDSLIFDITADNFAAGEYKTRQYCYPFQLPVDISQLSITPYNNNLRDYLLDIILDSNTTAREGQFSSVSRIFETWFKNIPTENAKKHIDNLGQNQELRGNFWKQWDKKIIDLAHQYIDFPSLCLGVKQIIGFSGSINLDSLQKIENLFFRNKEYNFYDIPPFFGDDLSKNRIEIVKNENTKNFINDVVEDAENAVNRGQPVLIFIDDSPNNNAEFNLLYQKLKRKFSIVKLISTEEEILTNLRHVGEKNTITLATKIIARGADIQVNGSIKKGLHLCITYYPEYEEIYTQMLGRTARQDREGSYSIISKEPKKFKVLNQILINSNQKTLHDFSLWIYNTYKSLNNLETYSKFKVALFMDMLRTYVISNNDINMEELKSFVNEVLLNLNNTHSNNNSINRFRPT